MPKKKNFDTPELSVEELTKALYEVNLELQASNNQILEEQRKNKEFYANISHDLRAPITAISNSLQYLLSSSDITPDEQHETLLMMQKRTSYIENLINDIFLLSSLESSSQKVHKEEVDLRFFLEDYFYMCEDDDRFSNCELQLDIAEDFDAKAMIDPVLMQRVLDNLFSNSLKYSRENLRIMLSAKVVDHNAVISVEDNGIGIEKEHLEHIFERSFQVEKARTPDASSGSGFGLSIVKSIIGHHGGCINCQSIANKMTRFTINIPII